MNLNDFINKNDLNFLIQPWTSVVEKLMTDLYDLPGPSQDLPRIYGGGTVVTQIHSLQAAGEGHLAAQ